MANLRKQIKNRVALCSNLAAGCIFYELAPLIESAAGVGRFAMGKHMKQSSRRVAKVVGAGLFAGGLLLGAPAGIASADPISDAVAAASEAGQKAVVAGSQTYQQAVVAGSQTYQQAVVAGSQSTQTAATATSNLFSAAVKGLFGF
jgi:hypothetical protein